MDKPEQEKVEYALRGKTLKVYLYLLRKGSAVGIREVQRVLSFSSPSVAFHHMEKLVNLGLVVQDQYGEYVISKKVDVGILQAFSRIGGFTMPRLGFYAAFFTVIAVSYLLLDAGRLNAYAVVGLFGSSAAFWYESWRVWRRRPF
ncbi:MAG: hypothetical protein JRN39_01585 [Nitrososphaerota archaeon]|nr:hypothetical protein [Nitrososphaerota archaeon]MDG6939079.1 hypothetical protein [Nitrososphaerota archaeon]